MIIKHKRYLSLLLVVVMMLTNVFNVFGVDNDYDLGLGLETTSDSSIDVVIASGGTTKTTSKWSVVTNDFPYDLTNLESYTIEGSVIYMTLYNNDSDEYIIVTYDIETGNIQEFGDILSNERYTYFISRATMHVYDGRVFYVGVGDTSHYGTANNSRYSLIELSENLKSIERTHYYVYNRDKNEKISLASQIYNNKLYFFEYYETDTRYVPSYKSKAIDLNTNDLEHILFFKISGAVYGSSSVLVDDIIYILDQNILELLNFDISNKTPNKVQSTLYRGSSNLVYKDNKLYNFGSVNGNNNTDMQIYDINTNLWSKGDISTVGSLSNSKAVVYDGDIYLLGSGHLIRKYSDKVAHKLTINTNVDNATVKIKNGSTVLSTTVLNGKSGVIEIDKFGDLIVEVSKNGYIYQSTNIVTVDGGSSSINFNLEYPKLVINTNVAGTNYVVKQGGVTKDNGNISGTSATISDLPTGSYEVTLSKKGYSNSVENITLSSSLQTSSHTLNPNSYTVTYNTNGGSSIASENIKYGTTYTLQTPTKQGYTFAGWYSDSGLTNAVGSTYTVGASDVTLYAKWYANIDKPIYTIDPENPIEPQKRELTLNSNVVDYDVYLRNLQNGYTVSINSVSNLKNVITILYGGDYYIKISKDNYDVIEDTINIDSSTPYNFNLYVSNSNPKFEIDPLNPIEPHINYVTINSNVAGYDIVLTHKEDGYVVKEKVDGTSTTIRVPKQGIYELVVAKDNYVTVAKEVVVVSENKNNKFDIELYVETGNPIYEIDPLNPIEPHINYVTINSNVPGYDVMLTHQIDGYIIEEKVDGRSDTIRVPKQGIYELVVAKEDYVTVAKEVVVGSENKNNKFDIELYVETGNPIYEIDSLNPIEPNINYVTINSNVAGYDVVLTHQTDGYIIEEKVEGLSKTIRVPKQGIYELVASKDDYVAVTKGIVVGSGDNEFEVDLYVETGNPIYEIDPLNPIEPHINYVTINSNVPGYDVVLTHQEEGYIIEEKVEGLSKTIRVPKQGIYELVVAKDDYITVTKGIVVGSGDNEFKVDLYVEMSNPIYEIDPLNPIEPNINYVTINSNTSGASITLTHLEDGYIIEEKVDGLSKTIRVPKQGTYELIVAKDDYVTVTKGIVVDSGYNEFSVDLYVETGNPIYEIDSLNPIEPHINYVTINSNVAGYDVVLTHQEEGYIIEKKVDGLSKTIRVPKQGIYELVASKDDYITVVKGLLVGGGDNEFNLELYVSSGTPEFGFGKDTYIPAPNRTLTIQSNKGDFDVVLQDVNNKENRIVLKDLSSDEIIPIMYSGVYNMTAHKFGYKTIKKDIDLTYSNEVYLHFFKEEKDKTPDIIEELPEEDVEVDFITDIEDKIDNGEIDGNDLDNMLENGDITLEEYQLLFGKMMKTRLKFNQLKVPINNHIYKLEFDDRTDIVDTEVDNYVNKETESTMISLRAVFGKESSQSTMLWNNETKRLDIVFANANVVMSFENNSSVMTLNNHEFEMVNHNGQELKVEVVDGRSMIPFRYISELLDLEVDYDVEKKKAIAINE